MLMLIAESKVALRSLAEIVPDPDAVEGLIQYVRDALETIAAGLAQLKQPPVGGTTGVGQVVHSVDRQAADDEEESGQRTRSTI
jgi:hypothetical protein